MKLKGRIFPTIFFVLSVFLLLYTFYKSEVVWKGTRINYYTLYYLLGSILLVSSIFIFFINYKIREYFFIIFLSILSTLYIFEFYLNSIESIIISKIYKDRTGEKFDKREKFEIYSDLKKNDESVVLNVAPVFHLTNNKLIPLSGVSNSQTIHCNENGYYSIYQSDRYGFNNPDSEWDQKEIEYLTLGDSFVQGSCVNRPNDITSVLRTLSNKSALNLGYGGNGPLLQYAGLREYLSKKVNKVVWVYFEGNDLINLNNELESRILNYYLDNQNFSQDLKNKQKKIDDINNFAIEKEFKRLKERNFSKKLNILKLSRVRTTLYNYIPEKYKPKPQPRPKPSKKFYEVLALAKNLAVKNNSKFYFVYLPEYSRYKDNYDNTNYREVKKIVKQLQIPFIDIHTEVFEKEENPLNLFPFKLSGHLNVDGYKKVSEKIYKLTSDNK